MILFKNLLKSTLSLALLAGFAQPVLAANTYEIDPVHSHLIFKIKHLNIGYQYGRFNRFSGTVVVDEKNPAQSKVEIKAEAASVDTNASKRDDHLRSPDFFNVKQFPQLSFKSSKVERAGAGQYKVSGILTLHGVSKPLSFTFKKTGEGKGMQGEYRMGGEAMITLKRSQFGMTTYIKEGGLSDEVTLILSFEGIKK
ncbi:polyisoprenoid-binding protein [bacterium (Candidatus Blackallbacteria) CG17_big_fil_post_rev_8_21_14_2_50_48_46]|uniref:Polyisoprenoid-binding protein n=1 Tax=bacterium (Candidatus Blackallbacteria) CG17_big_fil_post_rev_8_21_14_2_50_48_46 TaxID=2014261 RepID=A0A2M7G770_9BACT|nr:MAG: polyisoprenoid-binding protein [bacterium (Candidatus Blackallbacteria) CG18_big_fil_WC_8_21_14_2_50_49_26]PIW17783.1 MAG: polyisoprenoid-binding protein [bacterium (Candidatus Blackallbacteria) CG17_big_fil_post_rev_8_21_14_2_50_48_46]PIW47342.1 MAG: polyisoprenoid-binding protein [bacterium (Candidatus Blackallbacteria) CG13_big_fil_rev_8_21_14_2_50_49_14]